MGEEGNFSRKTFSWSEGSEWALGQASLLEVRSLEESKDPWRERGAELSLPSCLLAGQTLAAHSSPDATDTEPSLPQEPRRPWYRMETPAPGPVQPCHWY